MILQVLPRGSHGPLSFLPLQRLPNPRQVYDRYGDEERMPQQQRHHYQQDFMTPEDLFAAFFGGTLALAKVVVFFKMYFWGFGGGEG